MTLYSGNDHSKLALRRQQGLTENNLWISVSYNIGEGEGGGFTNNIITYVNKSGTEITRIMIMITKTLKLMVAATAMIINISFCCCDKKSPQMTRLVVCGVSVFPKNTITDRIK